MKLREIGPGSQAHMVAAVCEDRGMVFGEVQKNGRRPLREVKQFPHHGAARMWAQEFDERQRRDG